MMKKLYLMAFLLLFLFCTILYKLEFKQNRVSLETEMLQEQFDSLADDVIFSQQEVNRPMIDGTATGQMSIHDFPGLGIKVYSDDPYSESFKTKTPFIIKNGNMLIDKFSPAQYVEVIAKDPSRDMKNIYEEIYLKQFGTGCYTSIEKGQLHFFTGNSASNIDVYYAQSKTGPSICYIGPFPNEPYIQVWYNNDKSDRYYVVHLADGCAPDKCNVFNQIELY